MHTANTTVFHPAALTLTCESIVTIKEDRVSTSGAVRSLMVAGGSAATCITTLYFYAVRWFVCLDEEAFGSLNGYLNGVLSMFSRNINSIKLCASD